jgi:hypothetical protein
VPSPGRPHQSAFFGSVMTNEVRPSRHRPWTVPVRVADFPHQEQAEAKARVFSL